MRIAITDDKKEDRQVLKKSLKAFLSSKGYVCAQIEEFSCGEDLIASFEKSNYEIIFLDIFMKDLDGINTAKKIRETDTTVKIVFTTSSNDFASESYAVRADDYLLKPYSEEKLHETLEHLELKNVERQRVLRLPNGQSVRLNSISHTEFHGHYTHIQMLSGDVIKLRVSHSSLLEHAAAYPEFFACNKGMIVNLQNVLRFEGNCFEMKNGVTVPVSRRRMSDAKKVYADYLIDRMRKGEI